MNFMQIALIGSLFLGVALAAPVPDRAVTNEEWNKLLTCPEGIVDGFFRNPYDCSKFYRCYQQGSFARKDFQSCQDGMYFDETAVTCVPIAQYTLRHNGEPCKALPMPEPEKTEEEKLIDEEDKKLEEEKKELDNLEKEIEKIEEEEKVLEEEKKELEKKEDNEKEIEEIEKEEKELEEEKKELEDEEKDLDDLDDEEDELEKEMKKLKKDKKKKDKKHKKHHKKHHGKHHKKHHGKHHGDRKDRKHHGKHHGDRKHHGKHHGDRKDKKPFGGLDDLFHGKIDIFGNRKTHQKNSDISFDKFLDISKRLDNNQQ